jgi:hypothetical protein
MSPAEIAGRVRDLTVQRRWHFRQVRDAADDPLPVPADLTAPDEPLAAGAHVSEDARMGVKEAAEELLAGRWPMFAIQRQDMAPAPDWFLDPRTGRRAPSQTYCFDINHRDPEVVGNVKYVWEASRHQHITVLAAAFYLTGDERYATAAGDHLRSWWAANPFLSGIHWTSGIELGVRLLSWVWTRRLLASWSGAGALFERNPTFVRQLHHHQEYLARLPSRGSSANNHLLAEMAGQFAASCAFPYFQETAAWREQAATVLRRESVLQTFPSGLNREQATEYHGFVLELTLAAALEGEAAGHPLGPDCWETLRRMVDALAAIMDVNLHPPRQGDADDGHGLLLDRPDYNRWASLLATGEVLFGRAAWWPPVRRVDVRTALWTSLASPPILERPRPQRRPSLFADAGMALLRDEPGPEEFWCRADAGPHGYLGTAAHAHADALSIEVRVGGVEVLADPGTYCYGGEPRWRTWFRSTLGHNTLQVGGNDQSVQGGTHLWTRQAKARLAYVSGLDDEPTATWHALHSGYRRLHPPAVHHRVVRLHRAQRRLVVEDQLESEAEHDCCLAFHLGPEVSCVLVGGRALLTWPAKEETRSATLVLPNGLEWRRLEGSADPIAGWYSPSFDVRVPAISLLGLLGAGRLGRGRALITVLQLERLGVP